MAAGSTYTPIATTTLGSATPSITFSSISGSYTDLILIIAGTVDSNGGAVITTFNGDTGNNYSFTFLSGTGTTAASSRQANKPYATFNWNTGFSSTQQCNGIMQIQNYSNSTTYKTALARSNNANGSSFMGTEVVVNLWRNTNAINSLSVIAGGGANLNAGFIATLYGILAA